MKIVIECTCGTKEAKTNEKLFGSSTDIHLEEFIIEGHDDGTAFIRCKTCDIILDL